MHKFGLVGKNISYSFSKKFFTEKFSLEKIPATYVNFDLSKISEIETLLRTEPDLKGLNVTIPYKEKILPYLDEITPEAKKIGAVNTIEIKHGKLIGHNTDVFGFVHALLPLLEKQHHKALILGTGGASKAVAYGLGSLEIPYQFVSRKNSSGAISYSQLSGAIIKTHQIIIDCTPLGTYPDIATFSEIPYSRLGKEHLLFDLTYNPPMTCFLTKGKQQGAKISNGQKMLELQAEKAWNIWNLK